jgi:phosphopantothenoylcysteine decarboxylase / phosphopantothenate---cysteine ligase
MLDGKKILLGVSGSIAAYKAALLTRILVKNGAQVKTIMTSSAKEFITPLTLSTLSKNPVLSQFVKNENGEWNNHVELGLWADLMLIAPASANTISKLANGICDNLLSATYLSARCPVFIAPAMDLDMYQHPSIKANLEKLKHFGNHIIDAESGELASGLHGTGRMAEPENILKVLRNYFNTNLPLTGKQVLITAGPTYEAIDPVRFIGNSSSGKMGYAIAETMAQKGAKVVLVSGPADLHVQHPNINLIKIRSAAEMYQSCMQYFPDCHIAVLAAAVADYTPKITYDQKLKKKDDNLSIELIKTQDIAFSLGKIKTSQQFTTGFALETENEHLNALEKLKSKNFDLIVLNSLNDQGAGFGHDTNKISIIDKDNKTLKFGLKPKKEVALDIVNTIISKLNG